MASHGIPSSGIISIDEFNVLQGTKKEVKEKDTDKGQSDPIWLLYFYVFQLI